MVGTAWAMPAIAVVGLAPLVAASTTGPLTLQLPSGTGGVHVNGGVTYINIATNKTAFTLTGSGTTNKIVTIKIDGTTQTTAPAPVRIQNDGTWTATINVSGLSEGSHNITASDGATTASKTVVKDTIAPTVEATQTTIASNNKTGTISGTMNDGATAVIVIVPGLTMGTYTYTTTTWSVAWSDGKNQAYSGSVVSTDAAGNQSTADTFSWAEDAKSPVTL